jgi:hypothetical protein
MVLCTTLVIPALIYPIWSTDGICCNNVSITFDAISSIVTNGFILDQNNISDLHLFPIPATKV